MATNIQNVAPYDTIAHFDYITILIRRTFNVLIEQLIKRRDTLCQEVSQLRDDFHHKESARVAKIENLERTQQQLQQMSLESNINLPVHERAGIMYQEEKQQLCIPTPLPNLSFSCPTLSLLQSKIEQFGEVVQLKAPQNSEIRFDVSSLESETVSEPLTYCNSSEFETATEGPPMMEKCRYCHIEFESAITRVHMEKCLFNPEVANDLPQELSLPYGTCTRSADSSCDSNSESEQVCRKCHEVFTLSGLKSHAEECQLEEVTVPNPFEVTPLLQRFSEKSVSNSTPSKASPTRPKPSPRSVMPDPDKETPILPMYPLSTNPSPLLPPPIPARKTETEKMKCNICQKEIPVEEMPSHVEECRDKEEGQCPHCKEAFLITVLPDHTEKCQFGMEERFY